MQNSKISDKILDMAVGRFEKHRYSEDLLPGIFQARTIKPPEAKLGMAYSQNTLNSVKKQQKIMNQREY